VTDAELERSVTTYLTAQASFTETAGGLFGALVSWEQDGVELDSLVRLLRQLTELKLDDVRAVASSIADLEQAVIVVAGDPDIVLPQLVAMGFSEVTTVDLDVPID
jgi:predicted Zn-dependent peptidase